MARLRRLADEKRQLATAAAAHGDFASTAQLAGDLSGINANIAAIDGARETVERERNALHDARNKLHRERTGLRAVDAYTVAVAQRDEIASEADTLTVRLADALTRYVMADEAARVASEEARNAGKPVIAAWKPVGELAARLGRKLPLNIRGAFSS
jgi:hypothetical protein